jgi:hypothetical protein
MTLDASGNLTLSNGKLTAGNSGVVLVGRNSSSFPSPGDGYFSIETNNTDGSNGGLTIKTLASDTLSERARITSGGNLLVGTTTDSAGKMTVTAAAAQNAINIIVPTFDYFGAVIHNQGTSGDNTFMGFGTEAAFTTRGSIIYNRAGGLVAYNTTSDYRAKDILGPVQNSGATIDALKVYEGQMKGATQSRPMLIAHEAQEHTPYAVTGEKDAVNDDGEPVYQQMDVSAFVPLLLAEIQSLRARVVALESK